MHFGIADATARRDIRAVLLRGVGHSVHGGIVARQLLAVDEPRSKDFNPME
jgi:DeoR/GlpR family transcriptional regulator of sugar metabolism